MTLEVGKIVEKNSEDVLWYLEKGLVVTGHQRWLTKITSFHSNPISFFYGGMRLSAQETGRDCCLLC